MLGTKFIVSYHTAGTLAANHTFIFTAPFDMSLIAVSAVGSNANNGILDVGISSDTDLYLSNLDVGDSNVPATVSLRLISLAVCILISAKMLWSKQSSITMDPLELQSMISLWL